MKQFEYIMDNIPVGLMTLDAAGNIERYNRTCIDIFGYEAGEIVGKHIGTLIPEAAAATEAADTGVLICEIEARRKNGQSIAVEFRVTSVNIDGRKAFACVLQDISERKAAEDALRRSRDEMEQFAYIASHDLKAPLRGIDNLAQWIGDDLASVMTPDAEKNLKLLRNRVARITTLLEDILKYSRAGRVVEEGERIDTGELVRLIADPLVADGKFTLSVAKDMPVIHAPRTPLEQVFSNLISNAIKHHDKGQGVLRIGAEDRGRFIEFFVGDDGSGIPPNLHERAFQLFQTLKPRDKTEGAGLGLSIVKKLVEWQGGKVWIVSEEGKRGTEIRFLWKKR